MSKKYLISIVVMVLSLAFLLKQQMPLLLHWVQSLGYFAPVFFILIYCLCTLMFIPTTPLVLAGGALFGPTVGTLLNLASATISATCAFMLSRYIGLDWLSTHKKNKIQSFMHRIEHHGWKSVALCRLAPVIPCSIVNYGFGLTGIKFKQYVIATFFFFIPYKIIASYCGYITTIHL